LFEILEAGAVRRLRLAAGASVLALLATPVLAQTPPPAPAARPAPAPAAASESDPDNEVEELVVTAAAAPPGSVVSDIKPEQTLNPGEIRALGASSVSELLDALAPQLQSNQGRGGRPVMLVNGARISSFSEVRDLPPEAILRVQIFPEELALQYGYRAEQKVVNLILRRRFRATTVEAGVKAPTQGGQGSGDIDANRLQIARDDRLMIDVKANRSTAILESERDLVSRGVSRPFDLFGNVTISPFVPGAEIDPALSALAARTVTVAPIPAGVTGAPPLSAFNGTPNVTDVSPYRTLTPDTQDLAINAVWTHPMGNGVSATVNGTAEWNQLNSLLGLSSSSLVVPPGNPFSPFAGPVEVQRYTLGTGALERRNETLTAHLGGSLLGAYRGWNWTLTGNADRNQSESATDRGVDITALQARVNAGDPTVNPFADIDPSLLFGRAPDTTKAVETTAELEALANGRLGSLPAGGVMGSFTAGLSTDRLQSRSIRSGVRRDADLERNVGRLAANVVLPITSVRSGAPDGLGDLSLNLNAEIDHLSDFADVKTLGGGIRWQPWTPLRVIASYTHDETAPTIQQLGNPVVFTEAVRVFDFSTGQTVEVTQVSGGNPDLARDTRKVSKLGVELRPWSETNFSLRADYTRTQIRDEIASFPAATPEIEAAFPDRFVRADGRLVQVDVRPVNFARHDRSELKWGFTYSRPLGPQRPPGGFPRRSADAPAAANGATPQQAPAGGAATAPPRSGQASAANGGDARPPGGFGRGGFGGGGPGGFRGRGFGGGSFQVSLFHTWRLTDEVLIRPGVPVLDFLNGSAAGNGGGTPQHQIDLQAAVMKNGLGARLNARWQSATHVFGGTTGDDLNFSDLTTVSARLFADLGQRPIARKHPFFRGSRVALSVDNLFDQRQKVTAANGLTPVSYQPDLLDPYGRTIRLSFRKIFF
jgi:hypothetical protein